MTLVGIVKDAAVAIRVRLLAALDLEAFAARVGKRRRTVGWGQDVHARIDVRELVTKTAVALVDAPGVGSKIGRAALSAVRGGVCGRCERARGE
jgi:hypothetical protein